ncbi:hypothetical protein ACROYT_G036976 [Oculina patagonica]
MTGLTFGIYFGWLSMLDVFLAKFDIDANTAGWLGCAATLAGVVSGIALARCADYVKHRTKQLLVLLLALSTISQLVFSFSCAGILPSTKPLLYGSIIFGGLVYNGTLPLFFELAMESVCPVGEGIAGGILVTAGNVVLLLFYVAFMLPHSDYMASCSFNEEEVEEAWEDSVTKCNKEHKRTGQNEEELEDVYHTGYLETSDPDVEVCIKKKDQRDV